MISVHSQPVGSLDQCTCKADPIFRTLSSSFPPTGPQPAHFLSPFRHPADMPYVTRKSIPPKTFQRRPLSSMCHSHGSGGFSIALCYVGRHFAPSITHSRPTWTGVPGVQYRSGGRACRKTRVSARVDFLRGGTKGDSTGHACLFGRGYTGPVRSG
ncbi:hypothetical protein BDV59DRAFT_6372 [Aspergillus ambiguus]|uniref:uncharacterized protein n=1 Tax=Aspergillus ambiguus TaxID=176160 RepID=UPI003CCD3716